MTCTNIASLPYVVVLSTALLVRTLRPPGARVDTPYGRGCQVSRSAPPRRAPRGACGLRWAAVDFNHEVLCIERNRTTAGYEITEGGPKDRRRPPPGRHGQAHRQGAARASASPTGVPCRIRREGDTYIVGLQVCTVSSSAGGHGVGRCGFGGTACW